MQALIGHRNPLPGESIAHIVGMAPVLEVGEKLDYSVHGLCPSVSADGAHHNAVQPLGEEHQAVDHGIRSGHIGVVSLLVDTDEAGLVAGELEDLTRSAPLTGT